MVNLFSVSSDIFGQIYEYFLGNFALAEGQGGGAFYTPASVVQYMVEVLRPVTGDKKFLDPACATCATVPSCQRENK